MTKEELQFDLLKSEFELTQRQMDKYDQLSMTTKTWAVTLWVATVGWAFQVQNADVMLLGIVVIIMFWFFDALNKTFRQDYKKRRDEVGGALKHIFETQTTPAHVSAPQLPIHDLRDTLWNIVTIHTALPYISLGIISLILYVRF